ncbi:MAG: NAD(P) transhydrogenase subunit alpha [Acidothermales bacterium]|nr:NAD(P) transhydrogenase subunit alpha [Acidothermales bacterium]
MTVGVVKEAAAGERRVALVPEVVDRVRGLGADVVVEAGAGAAAHFPDEDYAARDARVVPGEQVYADADVVVCVTTPQPDARQRLRDGQVLLGLLGPLQSPTLAKEWAGAGVTAVSLDLLPRTLSRAQGMDALTSQANVAGYKAAVLAADTYGGYFPMLMTAAGTVKPAQVLVLGAGVAGLQAMATARRLGALVTGYDVRPEAHDQVTATGARFLELESVRSAVGEGGYARALTAEETQAQQAEMAERIGRFDVVVTTAQVPGGRPPLLVTGAALDGMRAGSVVVDLAAGPRGGNVEGVVPDATTTVASGVTVVGAGNLPAQVPQAASTAYARNVAALLGLLVRDGALTIDLDDEVLGDVVVTHGGEVVNAAVARVVDEVDGDQA